MNYKIKAEIFVSSDNDQQEVASTMDGGLSFVLSNFPSGDVVGARVDTIEEAKGDDLDFFKE